MSTTKQKFDFMSYAEFGEAFFEQAISIDRITEQFADLAGDESSIGPISADPLGVATVTATTRTANPTVKRAPGTEVTYAIAIPIDLELTIDVNPKKSKIPFASLLPGIPGLDLLGINLDSVQKLNYNGKVVVNLTLAARAARPLLIVIDIENPTPRKVKVDLQADGLLAALLQQGGIIEGEIKKAVVKEVTTQLDNPKLREGLVVDVAEQLKNA